MRQNRTLERKSETEVCRRKGNPAGETNRGVLPVHGRRSESRERENNCCARDCRRTLVSIAPGENPKQHFAPAAEGPRHNWRPYPSVQTGHQMRKTPARHENTTWSCNAVHCP